MRYTLLGDSGLRVSEISLGTMTFGPDWGFGADSSDSRAQFEYYAEAGGNFIDCAVNYTNGTAEGYLGELLTGQRDRWVLSTKYSLSTNPSDPNASGNSRKNLRNSLEKSLRRLKTDYIDVYWLHAWDFMTSPVEVMSALDDAVHSGKVLYVGISDSPAWVVARLQTIAELRGWSPFIGLQIEYSLAQRDPERELLPMAHALGLGVTAWGPLAGGVLTGKYAAPASSVSPRRHGDHADPSRVRIGGAVVEVAGALGATPAQVALAWVSTRNVIPIIGARTTAQLADSLGSLELVLEPEHLDALDAASAPVLGFPHDFLARDDIGGLVYGETRGLIDLPPGRRPV